jgi:hypothetical protein
VIRKVAIAIAAACVAWVVGVTLFYRSGGINPAGVVPSLGCLTALWGSVRSDSSLMWFGTGSSRFRFQCRAGGRTRRARPRRRFIRSVPRQRGEPMRPGLVARPRWSPSNRGFRLDGGR